MKIITAILCAFLCCGFGHGGGTFPSQVNKNIVTDYSAACNGIADDTTAWNNFVAANQDNNVVLTIPAGSTCCFLSTNIDLAKGLTYLRVIGYGATITNLCNGTVGTTYFMGAGGKTGGIVQDNTHSSLINTVSAGATSVMLITAAETSRFTVGQWAMLGGVDIQGFGYPPNLAFHDWVLVTAKDGGCTGTGSICFHDPIQNSYKSTWPSYSSSTWQGGPATLYAFDASWGNGVEYRGMTLVQKQADKVSDAGQDCRGRVCRIVDVTLSGTGSDQCGVTVSQNSSFVFQNITSLTTCGVVIDKLVDQVLFQGGSYRKIAFTSSAINSMIMTGTTIGNGTPSLSGTPVTATISNTTMPGQLQYGAPGYGVSLSVVQNSVTTGSTQDIGALENNVDSSYTMSGGVLSKTLPVGSAVVWAVPGRNGYFSNGSMMQTFTVTDINVSGGNVQVTTDQAGGFPFSGPITVTASPITKTIN